MAGWAVTSLCAELSTDFTSKVVKLAASRTGVDQLRLTDGMYRPSIGGVC
jgi:hypothetical protein